MNGKHEVKIHNIINNCLDCAGIEPHNVMQTEPKSIRNVYYYVDVCIEDCSSEDLAYFIGFMAQSIGMKNIWFDTYPKSKRSHVELVFDQEFLAR